MNSILSALFGAFIASQSAQVPVVQPADFNPGRAWTWDYFAENADGTLGDLYSTETYTVIERKGSEVLIEMSTIFPGEGNYRAHHRLLVPVDRCLAAYQNPVEKRPWSFRMFYREGENSWLETEPPTTLAFEEKFNCNGWQNDSRAYLTVFRESSAGREFMHKQWRTLASSWFTFEGTNAGVMIEKNFDHGAGSQNYLVKRR